MLADLLICGVALALLCGIAWIRWHYAAQPSVSLDMQAYSETLRAKMLFIIDVCDGDARKAEALVADKMAQYPQISAENALHQVYLDAQGLMEDVRAA